MHESEFGIRSFLTSTPGIGGRLRAEFSDFSVSEIGDHRGAAGGKYLVARIRAENWETNRLVTAMARNLGISSHRISFAGTKDKRAITERYFSFKEIDSVGLTLPRVEVLDQVRWSNSVRMGDLAGNRFVIRVREFDEMALESAVETGDALQDGGFPDYFGVQRFGALRGNTHTIGRRIIEGDLRGAVDVFLGNPLDRENDAVREARASYDAGSAPEDVAALFPRGMELERNVLESLSRHPDDMVRAIRTFPRNLQLMFVHAYQSYLFNLHLDRRLSEDMLEPLIGDLVAERNASGIAMIDRPHEVSERNLSKIARRCSAGKAAVLGPVPGTGTDLPAGTASEILAGIMADEGMVFDDFTIPEIPYLSTTGTLRPLLAPLMEYEYRENAVFAFRLPPGTYATSVMREFMKVGEALRY